MQITSITITLGEREFMVKEAGFMRARAWRERLANEVRPLFEHVGSVQDMEFATPADLLKLKPFVDLLLVQAMDTICDLLLSYSDNLATEQEYIKEQATDKQILNAFLEVVKLADPFGMSAAFQLPNRGPAPNGTLSNSPSPNGINHRKRQRS